MKHLFAFAIVALILAACTTSDTPPIVTGIAGQGGQDAAAGSGGAPTGSGGSGGVGTGTGGSGGGSGGSSPDAAMDRAPDGPGTGDAPKEMPMEARPDLGAGSAMYQQVQFLMMAKCSPCHIHETASELSLLDIRWTVNEKSVGCPQKVRIKAGDPAGSYLIDKVMGAPQVAGSCFDGVRMPEMDTPLVAAELKLLVDWIRAGAM